MKAEIDLKPAIKKLQIMSKDLVSSSFIGNYKSVFRGRGLEFESYRNYDNSDDASMIDWKASARSDELLVKQYVEERNLEIFLLVDVSDTMVSGTQKYLKNEYAAQLAATLSYAGIHSGDSVGIGFFNDKLFLRRYPIRGSKQFYILSKLLVDVNNYGGKCNFGQSLKSLFSYLNFNTILIVISDFLGMDNNWIKHLKILSQKFELIGMMIKDPIDKKLPETEYNVSISDYFSDKQYVIHPKDVAKQYNDIAKKQTKEVKEVFTKCKAGFLELDTSNDFLKPLLSFFEMRKKMLRR